MRIWQTTGTLKYRRNWTVFFFHKSLCIVQSLIYFIEIIVANLFLIEIQNKFVFFVNVSRYWHRYVFIYVIEVHSMNWRRAKMMTTWWKSLSIGVCIIITTVRFLFLIHFVTQKYINQIDFYHWCFLSLVFCCFWLHNSLASNERQRNGYFDDFPYAFSETKTINISIDW